MKEERRNEKTIIYDHFFTGTSGIFYHTCVFFYNELC